MTGSLTGPPTAGHTGTDARTAPPSPSTLEQTGSSPPPPSSTERRRPQGPTAATAVALRASPWPQRLLRHVCLDAKYPRPRPPTLPTGV